MYKINKTKARFSALSISFEFDTGLEIHVNIVDPDEMP